MIEHNKGIIFKQKREESFTLNIYGLIVVRHFNNLINYVFLHYKNDILKIIIIMIENQV